MISRVRLFYPYRPGWTGQLGKGTTMNDLLKRLIRFALTVRLFIQIGRLDLAWALVWDCATGLTDLVGPFIRMSM